MSSVHLPIRVTPSVLAIALFSMATTQTITAQSPAAAAQQPPVELNPTQEVAAEEPQGPSIAVGPAQLRIGGYLGVTGLYRSTSGGGGTGTSFASIPYADTLQGNLSETRLTAQASRITIRVDADFPENAGSRSGSGSLPAISKWTSTEPSPTRSR